MIFSVVGLEMVGTKHRVLSGVIKSLAYNVGSMSGALMAYAVRNHIKLQLIFSVLVIPSLLSVWLVHFINTLHITDL